MDWLRLFLEWAGDTSNSNAVRTIVALLAVPGALWGVYLFYRWRTGRDIASAIDKANEKLDSMITITSTGSGEERRFARNDIEPILASVNSQKYVFDGLEFSLSDVLKYCLHHLNGNHGPNRGVEGELQFLSLAEELPVFASKLGQADAVVSRRMSELKRRAENLDGENPNQFHWPVGASNSELTEPAARLMQRIFSDLVARNIFRLDSWAVEGSVGQKYVLTDEGMAVLKALTVPHRN